MHLQWHLAQPLQSPCVSGGTFEYLSVQDPFLSCTTHTDSSSNEQPSQEQSRSVSWSSQVQSTPVVTASGEAASSIHLLGPCWLMG